MPDELSPEVPKQDLRLAVHDMRPLAEASREKSRSRFRSGVVGYRLPSFGTFPYSEQRSQGRSRRQMCATAPTFTLGPSRAATIIGSGGMFQGGTGTGYLPPQGQFLTCDLDMTEQTEIIHAQKRGSHPGLVDGRDDVPVRYRVQPDFIQSYMGTADDSVGGTVFLFIGERTGIQADADRIKAGKNDSCRSGVRQENQWLAVDIERQVEVPVRGARNFHQAPGAQFPEHAAFSDILVVFGQTGRELAAFGPCTGIGPGIQKRPVCLGRALR